MDLSLVQDGISIWIGDFQSDHLFVIRLEVNTAILVLGHVIEKANALVGLQRNLGGATGQRDRKKDRDEQIGKVH